MARFFRITKAKWVATAMNGDGAKISGGRWNPPGVSVVYLGDSRALAALEILVHTGREAVSWDWRVITVDIPDELIDMPDASKLPDGWDAVPSSIASMKFGADWVSEGRNPAILLPSAVIPAENALILNVRHPAMGRVKISTPEPFLFDARLS